MQRPVMPYGQSMTSRSDTTGDNSMYPTEATANHAQNKSAAARMNHIVTTYNNQGKVFIKFIDSSSQVVYQIPSAMMAELQNM